MRIRVECRVGLQEPYRAAQSPNVIPLEDLQEGAWAAVKYGTDGFSNDAIRLLETRGDSHPMQFIDSERVFTCYRQLISGAKVTGPSPGHGR